MIETNPTHSKYHLTNKNRCNKKGKQELYILKRKRMCFTFGSIKYHQNDKNAHIFLLKWLSLVFCVHEAMSMCSFMKKVNEIIHMCGCPVLVAVVMCCSIVRCIESSYITEIGIFFQFGHTFHIRLAKCISL